MRKITRSRKSGFTLIEVILASSILMIAILGAGTFYLNQVKQEKTISSNLETKTVLDSFISFVSASPEEYAVLSPLLPANPFAMYVFCMTRAGMVVANQVAGVTSTAIVLPGSDINIRAMSNSLEVCSTDTAQVEIHMAFKDTYVAEIVALQLPLPNDPTGPAKFIGKAAIMLNAQLGSPTKID